jgi:membrane protein DedA with SNARE-associated domain
MAVEDAAGPFSAALARLAHVLDGALSVVGTHAALMALVASFLESLPGVGILFPGGTIVVLAAYTARSQGAASMAEVVVAAWLGLTAGAAVDFWLGRALGRRLVPRRAPWRLAARWRHTLGRSRRFMARWGWWAVIAANLAGPGRSSVALAAGASGWSFASFIAGQSLASAAWCALYCGLGFFAGGREDGLDGLAGSMGAGAAVLVLALAAISVLAGTTTQLVRRLMQGRDARAAASAGDSG